MERTKAKEGIEEINDTFIDDDDEISNNCFCPQCRSRNVYGVSRVVGYFSIIENWNKSKKAELKKRQKGNYWYKEEKGKD